MLGQDGAISEAETKLRLVLEKLRQLEAGPARIANLCWALETNHVSADQLRDLISSLQNPSDQFDAFALLLTHIRGRCRNLYFRRPSPPIWNRPVALVLDWALLDQGEQFHLFSREYIMRAKALRQAPGEIANASELDDALVYIRKGFREGLGNFGLGEQFTKPSDGRTPSGRVVFVTPVDEFWEGLTAKRFRGIDDPFPDPGPANQVCDYLGLPYRNMWLVELRSRLPLSELVKQGELTLAAPTVLEAWVHDYFRHWPRDATVDAWGKTLHVGNGRVGIAEPPGLPEAIVDHLPPTLLSTAFDVSILGRVTHRPIPRQNEVNDFLFAKRDLKVLIDGIVSKVMAS